VFEVRKEEMQFWRFSAEKAAGIYVVAEIVCAAKSRSDSGIAAVGQVATPDGMALLMRCSRAAFARQRMRA
jgi:hypothetical protein